MDCLFFPNYQKVVAVFFALDFFHETRKSRGWERLLLKRIGLKRRSQPEPLAEEIFLPGSGKVRADDFCHNPDLKTTISIS